MTILHQQAYHGRRQNTQKMPKNRTPEWAHHPVRHERIEPHPGTTQATAQTVYACQPRCRPAFFRSRRPPLMAVRITPIINALDTLGHAEIEVHHDQETTPER